MPDETNTQPNPPSAEVPQDSSSTDNQPQVEVKADKIKAAPKRVKPMVEGINAPQTSNDVVMVKPTLTVQEKRLISETDGPGQEKPAPEPKLLPKSVIDRANQEPKTGMGKIIGIIILLILGIGGYQLYKVLGMNDNSNPIEVTPQPSPEPVDLPTSTPVTIPAGNATSTASSSPSVAPTPPPAQTEKKLKINSTPTGWLNFRNGPSLSAAIITKVNPGEIYDYSEVKDGWYKITLTDGRVGWVFGQYVTLQ